MSQSDGAALQNLAVDPSLLQEAQSQGFTEADILGLVGPTESEQPVDEPEDSLPGADEGQDAEESEETDSTEEPQAEAEVAEQEPVEEPQAEATEQSEAPDDLASRIEQLERLTRQYQSDKDRADARAKSAETRAQTLEAERQEAERQRLLSMDDHDLGAYFRSEMARPKNEADLQREAQVSHLEQQMLGLEQYYGSREEWQKAMGELNNVSDLDELRSQLIEARVREELNLERDAQVNTRAAKAAKGAPAVPDSGGEGSPPPSYNSVVDSWVESGGTSDAELKALVEAAKRSGSLDPALLAEAERIFN